MNFIRIFVFFVIIFSLIGCTTTPTQTGALGGGAIGAVAGQLIGGNTKSTLIGAGVGALGGALANDYIDKQKQQAYQQGAQSQQQVQQGWSQNSTMYQQVTVPSQNVNVVIPEKTYNVQVQEN